MSAISGELYSNNNNGIERGTPRDIPKADSNVTSSDNRCATADPDLDSVSERLWTAGDVAHLLRISRKKVYGLPIPKVEISPRRVRYTASDVRAFIRKRRVA